MLATARKLKPLLHDPMLLATAHRELCMSTRSIFYEVYDGQINPKYTEHQYQEWVRSVRAITTNKQINGRRTLTHDEECAIQTQNLPMAVKMYILVRLAG